MRAPRFACPSIALIGSLLLVLQISLTRLLSAAPLGPLLVPAMMLVVGATSFGVFYFTGYAVAFLLSEYAADTGRIYWADLWGASLGCSCAALPLGRATHRALFIRVDVSGGEGAALQERCKLANPTSRIINDR